ncbi:MAG: AMP-binding protein [Patulibacter sp.]|nr:AMP-binding protein [Patulibacter sp.]
MTATLAPHVPSHAPSRVPSLGWLVAWNAARRPDAPAIREADGLPLDHRALAGRVGALAARLRQNGVARGDTVAVLVSGVADHLVATLAVSTVAAVAIPLDPGRTDEELTAAATRAGARTVLADHGNGGRLPIERIAIGVGAGGAPLVVADADLDAVQRWMPSRHDDGERVAVTNGAALWAQAASIRELDLRARDAVRVRNVRELIAEIDVGVLATLAAGGTIVCGANGPTPCRELPRVVTCDAVVGPVAVVGGDGERLLLAGDLDGRVGSHGTLELRGPRSVGRPADAWVDGRVAAARRADGRLALVAAT